MYIKAAGLVVVLEKRRSRKSYLESLSFIGEYRHIENLVVIKNKVDIVNIYRGFLSRGYIEVIRSRKISINILP